MNRVEEIMAHDLPTADELFGPIPAAFFALLGQTIAVASLVELRVYDLVTSLDGVEQHVYAGEPLGKMIKRCRWVLSVQFVPEFASKAEEALQDVERHMKWRNVVVHDVWTLSRDGRIVGWRPAPVGQRDQPEWSKPGVEVETYGIATQDWTESGLRSLFVALACLERRISRLRDESEWSRILT